MLKENQKMDVVIYVRVSTEMQEEKDSLNNQIERCSSYCKMKGFNVVSIYKDVESGAKDNRLDFQKMLSDMELGLFQAIVVTELSRISRKLITLINFLENFQSCNVNFISITQNIDTSTLMGRIFFQLIGVLAEFERGQTRERVVHTMHNMAKRGKFTGGVIPFGYESIDKKLIVKEDEADIVKQIYDLYLSGVNRSQISKKFNLSQTTTRRILSTPFYTGKVVYSKRKVNTITGKLENQPEDKWIISNGEHDAIIDNNTYERAKEIYNDNYTNYVKYEDNPNFLLTGLIRCYHGHKMYGHVNTAEHRYYMCNRNTSKYTGDQRCTQYMIKSDALEREVIDYILKLKAIDITLDDVNKIKVSENRSEDKVNELTKRRKSTELKRRKLIDLMLNGSIEREDFEERNNAFSKELENIDAKVKQLTSISNETINKATSKEIFYEVLNSFDPNKPFIELKQLLAIIISEIRFINDFEYEIIFNL